MCHDDKETLIRHPAKRLIMGFIRVLITDALTTPPFLKAASLVDTILEVNPPYTSTGFGMFGQFWASIW
jgi:hypothetical protein